MKSKGLVLFDIDGVIRSVENSYRLSLRKTVEIYTGWEPSFNDIDSAKNEGIWNNDWDLSLELIKRHNKKKNASITIPLKKDVIKCFNNFYFGNDMNIDSKDWTGFIKNEELLVDKKFFDILNKNKLIWGFVSGAELASAKFVLEKRLKLKSPPLIAMEDAPEKPNPRGFIQLSKKLLGDKFRSSNIPIAYIGDTIADVMTVINARKKISNQKFISIGIAPPHLHLESRLKERNAYESNLRKAGANFILESIYDLLNIDLDLF